MLYKSNKENRRPGTRQNLTTVSLCWTILTKVETYNWSPANGGKKVLVSCV